MNKSQFCQSSRYRTMAGVGILEVLVALVVVSIGVLGVAGLQLTGMKHSAGGYNRFQATLLAENLAARMRTNTEGVEKGHYNSFDSASDVNCQSKPSPYCQSSGAGDAERCNVSEMAAFDFFSIACGNWSSDGSAKNGVLDELANGRLQVSCDAPCDATSNYTVLITWDENTRVDGNEGSTSQKRVQVRFNP